MSKVADELIEMRGLRFHYRDWLIEAGRGCFDLVLLHGFTGHARSWDAFAEAMTDRYRVLALDQRGHGETGWAAADKYGNTEMVDDLAAFVSRHGLAGFHPARALHGRDGGHQLRRPGAEGTRPPRYRRYRLRRSSPPARLASRAVSAPIRASSQAARKPSPPPAPAIRGRPRITIASASSTI